MYPYYSKNLNDKNEVKVSSFENLNMEQENSQEEFENYVLDMILQALEQENEDMMYYEKLSTLVQDEKDKEVLRRIHLDDMKHFNMLNELYKDLSGKEPVLEYEEIEIDDKLPEEFLDAAEQKLENVDLYRNIMKSFLDVGIRDMIFSILTDEQAHSQKLNQLYNKHKK